MSDRAASAENMTRRGNLAKSPVAIAGVVLALYAVVLVLLAPLSPFEWDEVLFQRALDRYDVAAFSPHPPGYPVYVGAGWVVRLILKNPLWALQAVSIVATLVLAAVPCLLAWRRVLPWSVAAGAAVLTAAVPAVAFNATVGLSDITGAAAGFSALILIGASLGLDPDRRSWPPEAAAVLTAVALGVRPQLAMLLGLPWLWLLGSLFRDRRWGPLIRSTLLVPAVSAAIWAPAVAITGLERYLDVFETQREWMATHEKGYRLPGAPVHEVLEHWLERPFGPSPVGPVFWLTVCAGAVGWAQARRRNQLLLLAAAGFPYFLGSWWVFDMSTSVRYIVPAIPPLAAIAAGVVWLIRPRQRRIAVAVLAAQILVMTAWASPILLLRAREEAPAWACLEYAAAHYPRDGVVVVHDGIFGPHAEYLLARVGFKLQYVDQVKPLADRRPLYVVRRARPPASIEVMSREWTAGRLRKLARGRYHRCRLFAPRPSGSVQLEGKWSTSEDVFVLSGPGAIVAEHGVPPVMVSMDVTHGGTTLSRGGREVMQIKAPASLSIAVGSHNGRLELDPHGPELRVAFDRESESDANPATMTTIIPIVADIPAAEGDAWSSRLYLVNPGDHTATVDFEPLFSDARARTPGSRARVQVRPRQELTIDGVLPALFATDGIAALTVSDSTGAVDVKVEVSRRSTLAEQTISVPLVDASSIDATGSRELDLAPPAAWSSSTLNLALAAPSDVAVGGSVVLAGSLGTVEVPFSMAPRSFELREIDPAGLARRAETIRATVNIEGSGRIVVSAAVVDRRDGTVSIAVAPAHSDKTSNR